jgi:hypothetical protein
MLGHTFVDCAQTLRLGRVGVGIVERGEVIGEVGEDQAWGFRWRGRSLVVEVRRSAPAERSRHA